MKIINVAEMCDGENERQVVCPKGGFVSHRFLVKSDGMGFGMTNTFIPKGRKEYWHYKNHLEACYCIEGEGILTDVKTGLKYEIKKDIVYILDKNDPHEFESLTDVVLICVFNPPLSGKEVHDENGSYNI